MDVFTVVVFLYNVGVAYFQQCTVKTLRVDADKTGARLKGYTYITFSNIGPNACYNECIRRTKCRSFNYNSITRRCDINKMSSSSETDFVDETNCVYVDMTQYRGDSYYDPCPGSDACVEGEFCQSLKDNINICNKDVKECLNDWISFSNHCYLFVYTKMSWENAKVQCQTGEGYLVKIENSEENTWIKSIVKDQMWIGLNDRQTEGHWVWDSDNSSLTYNDWSPVNPNGGKRENCCMFCKASCSSSGSSYRWNDAPCYYEYGYVCEKLL
ncbi:neurocan core protein [Mytilus galloprovincialis]|uniref:Neurocan core protein n=1 Tax=Mytilus galloprovincialis TaxID=29158 RepID=A0A8B6G1R2_MYTGA|nr:neurocan core protein [Mytilus galloprovincialis]